MSTLTPNADVKTAPSLFRDRKFVLLWLGQLISNLGDAALLIAVPVTVYNFTNSKGALSLVTILGAVPTLLLGLFAGVFVDRWDRRRTMIVSDLGRAASVLLLLRVHGPQDTWLFYVASFLIAAFSCFFSPARQATLKVILPGEQLMRGNALITSGMQITGLIGPVLGGVLLHWLHPAGVFMFDAVTFMASATCLLLLSMPRVAPTAPPRVFSGVWKDMTAGVRYVASSPVLSGIVLLLLVVTVGAGISNTLEYPFVRDIWHAPTHFSYLMAIYGVGLIVAGLLVSGPLHAVAPKRLAVVGCAVFTLGGLVWAVAPDQYWGGGALFIFGMGNMLLNIPLMTLFQTSTSPEMMGRVSATFNVVGRSGMLLAGALAAVLGSLMPLPVLFAILAGLYLICTLLVRPLLERRPKAQDFIRETVTPSDAGTA